MIKAQEHRSQARNKRAAIERLAALIVSVATDPKPRIPTRPSKEANRKRIESKRRQGTLKRSRGRVDDS